MGRAGGDNNGCFFFLNCKKSECCGGVTVVGGGRSEGERDIENGEGKYRSTTLRMRYRNPVLCPISHFLCW